MVPRDERMEKVFQTNGTINKQSVTVLTPSRASQRPKGSHFIYGNNLSRGHDNSQFPCTQLICAAISQTKTAKCKIRDRTEIGLGRSACHTSSSTGIWNSSSNIQARQLWGLPWCQHSGGRARIPRQTGHRGLLFLVFWVFVREHTSINKNEWLRKTPYQLQGSICMHKCVQTSSCVLSLHKPQANESF